MSSERPRLVVSLPGRTIEEVRAQARLAAEAGADAAEVRVDRLRTEELKRLGSLFPSGLALVATYRSRSEGGEGADDPSGRRSVLLEVARHPFRWLDLEVARDLDVVASLPSAERLGRIFSAHPAARTPEDWVQELGRFEALSGVGKLVVRASVGDTLRVLVPASERLGHQVVIHTTGPSGALLRAWSGRFGFPLVYAALPSSTREDPVEPSQIAVDRLGPYLSAEERPPLFAVCGRPVGHSSSPGLHETWMREDGAAGLYLPLEFGDDAEFVDALPALAAGGFRGLNVTHPLKTVAAEAATELGPGARACQAANCLSFRDGAIAAENTDLLAILRRFRELVGEGLWDGRSVGVLGAGGAARATLAAAREVGAAATVFARRRAEAEQLSREFGAAVGEPSEPSPSPLLVHATAVGRSASAEQLELPLSKMVRPGVHLLDWVYHPTDARIERTARAAGATYEGGWRLLVYQAAASYEIWWGHPPAERSIARAAEGGS